MKKNLHIAAAALGVIGLAGCAAGLSAGEDPRALAHRMIASSFRAEGIAGLDRLQQDESNRECSEALGQPLPEARARAIEAENLKTVRPPSDGRYLGDWKQGERIAQDGRGLTFTDSASVVNGGNCYNCHQITKQEISFGTIGPSLYNYGRLRGVADPAGEAARPIVEYTWGKLVNARAYNACSTMPRFGHKGIMSEEQLRHLMALLLDPRSPVNQ